MVQALEERSKGAKAFQTEAPTPGEPPELQAGGSGKAVPTKMAPNREQVLETTCGILERIHALHLQTMHEMGSVREVDRTLAQTLIAEFVRLQLIVGEHLTKSLMALCTDLEASCAALVSDIARTMDLHPMIHVLPGESGPQEVPADHFTEGNTAPNRAGGGP